MLATTILVGVADVALAASSQANGKGGITGTIEANPLTVRGGPGSGYNAHGTLAYASRAQIPCWEYGNSVTATWPNGKTYTTSVWDAIADGTGESNGLYVSDAWVNTGGNTAAMLPECKNIAADPGAYPWPSVDPNANVPDGFGYFEGECTSFAAWELRNDRYPNIAPVDFLGNARDWVGRSWTSVPHVGDIAQWDGGRNGAGGNGHVAYVAAVHYDAGTIDVYEYNFRDSYNGWVGHRLSIRTLSWSDPSRYLQF